MGKVTILIIGVIIQTLFGIGDGIIGYDCGHRSANISTISLLQIDDCELPEVNLKTTKQYIQLLQINDFEFTKVIQCKVEIDRSIRRCGMFSHTMEVPNGKYAYIQETSQEACSKLHHFGMIRIGNVLLTEIRVNQSISRPITLAGSIDSEGKCDGEGYSDPFGTWEKVVVIASVKITLREYTARVKPETNKIYLKSGTVCELNTGHCLDIEGGNTYWNVIPQGSCDFSKYGILYQGDADKVIDELDNAKQIIYSLMTDDVVFALTAKSSFAICGYHLIRTEHPKLIIFETTRAEQLTVKKKIEVDNLDIFTYINSKFIYVEKHVRTQVKQLYRDVLTQQCNLEKQMLRNTLSIASQTPDIFAYHLMKGPGYMALTAGEVVHVIKCIPVEVTLMKTTDCYNHLPVLRGNESYFLTPQTHILMKQGTQITCSTLVPPMYQLENDWYRLTPKPVQTSPPMIMKPKTEPRWKYISPGNLATSGIYTEEDLDELRDHIMFPAEKPALLNTLARGIMGQPVVIKGGSISNLLDEQSLEKITKSAWHKLWGNFLVFGNISAGIIGIFVAGKTIKLIIDTLIHGYALHSVYGWSLYLLGAIWDSVTHLLLHLSRRSPNGTQEAQGEESVALVPSAPSGLYPHLREAGLESIQLKDIPVNESNNCAVDEPESFRLGN